MPGYLRRAAKFLATAPRRACSTTISRHHLEEYSDVDQAQNVDHNAVGHLWRSRRSPDHAPGPRSPTCRHPPPIDPTNGQEIWRSENLGGATVGTPAISEDGNSLFIGTFINELVTINTSNGNILWRFPTEGWVWASPVLDGDVLYFGDIAGNFYAIDRNSQAQLWSLQTGSDIVGTPLLTEDGIYFTNEAGTLYALTHDGATRWTNDFEATLHTGPVAAGDLILVATDEGGLVLYAIDSGGSQKWQFSPAEE